LIRIIDHEGNGYGAQAEITRKKGVNGEKSLTGVIYTNEEVLHGVDRGWKLEFENEIYAFTFALPKDTGNRIELDFDAVHEFFFDMSKDSQNDLLNDGSHTFKAYLDFIFGDTPYNYSLEVDVSAFEKETFGQRNRLDLFYDVIDTAGVEFSVNGSTVRIIERVGNDLSTIVKKGFNLNDLQLEKNIGDFVTYQKGFGAWFDEEDHSKGRLEVEYLSPLADIYGKLDADPVVDERYAVRNNLLARLQSNVEGSYQISVQIDMEDLTRAGYEYKQPHEGDSIMAINEDLGFQRKVRIVSYETDFDIEGNILDHRITCNSIGMVEQSISSTNGIKYAINELQNDLELARNQITEARLSADGKSMNYYGPVEPTEDDYKLSIGDTWFDTSGENTVIKAWNGVEWRNAGLDSKALQRQFDEVKREIQSEKERIDDVVQQIDVDITDKFTSLDETISDVQSITNAAQASADVARDHALDALSGANTAMIDARSALNGIDQLESTVADINIDIDEINGTLSLKADSDTVNALDGTVSSLSTEVGVIAGELSAKADSSLVDTISGIVDNHTLDIQANAEGLALKANQDTVDTLAGTVQSLGTEFNAVAGQVNSRVWNTDIETAIDDIEVGGRNYLLDSERTRVISGFWISWDLSPAKENLAGREVTVSFYAKGNNGYSNHVQAYYRRSNGTNLGTDISTNRPVSAEWEYYEIKIPLNRIPEDMTEYSVFALRHLERTETISVKNVMLSIGTMGLDWTPAPEDTLAKFDHIGTEWTQTFDEFSQTVSSIDGRVSKQEQRVDSITTTIQEVQSDIDGNTKLINQTKSTVDTHTQTIATIETDLDGKATVTQYNTIKNTIDSTIQRIGDAEGNITQIEANIDGLQSTVADKASQTEVTQLSNLYSVVVSDLTDLETDTEAQFSVMSEQINLRVTSNQLDTAISDSLSTAEAYADATAQTAQEAAQEYAETKAAAERELAEIYASGLISAEQQERITAIENNLSEAQSYAETKASEAKTASDAYTDIVAKDKVDIGKVVSQINIETDNILIESGKLLLDADTVAFSGSAFIPGAYIENASIDNAKIANATITSGKIANLDVNKLSGNRTEFVQSAWNNAVGGNVSISGSGIRTTASDGSQGLIQNGVFLARRPESGSTVGYIGYDQSNGPSFQVTTTLGAHFKVRNHLGNKVYKDLFSLESGGATARFSVDQVLNNSGKFRGYEFEPRYGGRFYSTSGYETRLYGSNNNLYFMVGSDDWSGRVFRMNTTRNFSYVPLNMDGNEIYSSPSISDERLKNIHGLRTDNDLEKLMKIEYVNFTWKSEERGGDDLGFIAQQIQNIVPEIIMESANGYLGYNSNSYMNFIGHSVQQLSLAHDNTNLVASEALILAEETNILALNNKSEIDLLKEENKELRTEIQKLKEVA